MSSTHYENQLLDAIETMVDNAVSRAEYDKTIRAVVQSCLDETTGKYRIKYQDSTFDAFSNNLSVKYADGTQVYILVPKNDMSQSKIILHAVDKETLEYAAAGGVTKHEPVGSNAIGGDTYELCSYDGETIITLYDKDNGINLINFNEIDFAEDIKNGEGIKIGGTFKTALSIEQQKKGNFGIIYTIDFTDTITGNIITRTYCVDVNNMRGNPYLMTKETEQEIDFTIDTENYRNINSIAIFAKNFSKTITNKPADIFISNFKLQSIRIASDGYSLRIKMDKNYFSAIDSDDATITASGNVYLDGNIADKVFQYYWFRRNTSIITDSDKYVSYAGAGWECLNEILDTDSETGDFQYVTDKNYYTIDKEDCLDKINEYKLVAVSNDLVVNTLFEIRNYGSNHNLTMTSDDGTTFYFDNGAPTLTVLDNGKEIKNYKYVWAKEDNNGQIEILDTTAAYNNEYNNTVAAYNMLKAQIDNGTLMSAASQAKLNAYLTTIKKFNKIQRVENNHIYKTNISLIDDYAKYICSVFNSSNILIGTTHITLYKIMSVEGEYTILINNGNQTFNYNVDGIAPTSETLDNPIILQPLSITMIDNKGNEFTDDMIKNCNIKWTIPDNGLVIAADSGDTTLSYTLEEIYDINKIENNTIKVEVSYKEHKYTAQTTFTFVKDGEPGTNGTGVICKIVPNLKDGITLDEYPMLVNGTLNFEPKINNKWFKVQLWKNGNKIWEGTDSGNDVTLTFENLANKYTSTVNDTHSFSINNNNFTYNSYQENGADIIKATVVYDGATYYATLPLIVCILSNNDYNIKLVKNTGFRYVMYSSDGKNPKYDNVLPFELQVLQQIDSYTEDVTNITNQYALNYTWSIKGSIYNGSFWENDTHMTLDSQNGSKASYIPDETYDGENVTNAIQVVVKKGTTQIAAIHIPIHFYLDRYGISAINGWDGNSILLNQNEGMILTPQVGAGSKDDNNRFTGVVIGSVKEKASSSIEQGLLGYSHGQRTIFLDADTGRATFGKTGVGQIILDPTNNTAKIQSGNYSTTNKTGMLIDFSTPEIKFGSGKFSVDAQGNLKSTSGTIANWTISEDALTQESGNIYLGKKKTATINNTSRNNIVMLAGANFGVSSNGILYANSAILSSATVSGTLTAGANSKIGPWNVTNTSIYYGNANYGNTGGIYLGTSGLSLGSTFKVSASGSVTATDGKVGGWSISNSALYTASNNYYLGTTGITATIGGTSRSNIIFKAGSNFGVNSSGTLYAQSANLTDANVTGEVNATSGTIGGCSINDGSLEITSGHISSINASTINSGRLNITDGSGHYLRMGFSEGNNPSVSGLNVGDDGINMHGNSIGNCQQIGTNVIGSYSTGDVTVNTDLYIAGGTYYKDWNDNYHNLAGLYQWYSTGTNATVWIECGEGLGWKQFIFSDGLLIHLY